GLSTGSSFVSTFWGHWNLSVTWVDVMVGDFNGDGKSDIAGRVREYGDWWGALSTGNSFDTQLWHNPGGSPGSSNPGNGQPVVRTPEPASAWQPQPVERRSQERTAASVAKNKDRTAETVNLVFAGPSNWDRPLWAVPSSDKFLDA